MDASALFLAFLLPLSIQLTPAILREVRPSAKASEASMEEQRGDKLSGSLPPNASASMDPPEEDEWAPIEAYLYSGNVTLLAQVNCSRAYSLPVFQGVPAGLRPFLSPAVDALTNAANFLNMIFQANDIRESSVIEDMEWYQALVRGLVESDPLIRRALLAFDAQPGASRPQLVLRASRYSSKPGDILLQDLSSAWESMHPPPPAPDASWFTALKFPEQPQQAPSLSKRLLLNDLNTLATPKWGRGDSYVTNRDGVRWADAPFLECESGRFVPDWLLTLSTSFYGLKPDLSPEFRGVIRVDVSLQSFDLDQCAKEKDWFSNTHQCNRTSMQCEPTNGLGFRLGQYRCRCRERYYSPEAPSPEACYNGSRLGGPPTSVLPVCLPCWPGCLRCEDGSPCRVQEDRHLRAAVLTVQGFFMLLIFISMLAAYQFRRSTRIRPSSLLLLETILFGSLLLYFPVFILYFQPSTFRCILLRWVRLLGFAIVYGTVTLKMHRVLKVFLSHMAQRVPYISTMQLLRQLGVMLLTVSWFLSAWTAAALQNSDRNVSLLITSTTSEGQSFTLCDLDSWDYMMAIAEILFLCWGSFLYSGVKMVPSAFHEPRYMGIAIHNELLLSSAFHLLRFSMPSLHPDRILLLFFIHTHVTVTVTLCLLFIPKFMRISQPLQEVIAVEVYEDEVDLRRSGSYLNSSFTSAWSEHSLDPDDIRDELKKLYSQLEIHKTKKMTTDNPHLPKKSFSRHSIGRSIMKCITKFPESLSRRNSREDKDGSAVVGGRSLSGSFSKVLESRSLTCKEESMGHRLSIHKSQSPHYDCQFLSSDAKDHSVLASFIGKSPSKKASVHSDSKFLDSEQKVYKSVSAHDLSADKKLLLEPSKLQKSLSFVTRDNSLHPNRTNSFEDSSQHSRANVTGRDHSENNATITIQTTNTLRPHSIHEKECVSKLNNNNLQENRSQRHVTSFLSLESDKSTAEGQISARGTLPYDPIRHDAKPSEKELLTHQSEKEDSHGTGNEESDSDSESKPKVPVSSSAPGSPITALIKPKKHRVLSCYSSPHNFSLSVKGTMMSGNTSSKDDNQCGSNCNLSPVSLMANVAMSDNTQQAPIHIGNKLPPQSQQSDAVHASPCAVKQDAVRVSSNESQGKEPKKQQRTLENTRICPQANPESESVERQNGSLANISGKMERGQSMHEHNCPIKRSMSSVVNVSMNAHNQNASAQITINKEVHTKTLQRKTQRLQSSVSDICSRSSKESSISPVKKDTVRSASVGFRNIVTILKQRSTHANICPWETQDQQITSKTQATDRTNICPWESDELKKSEDFPQNVSVADVCPWDVPDTCNPTPQRKQSTVADVCPWDVPDPCYPTPQRKQSIIADICPWDVPDPSKQTTQRKQSIVADVCPWDVPDPCNPTPKRKQSTVADICPSNVPDPSKQTTQRKQSIVADVCPWDVPDPCAQATQRKQSDVADVCPWDVPGPCSPTPQRKQSAVADICPWDVPDPSKQTTQRKQSIVADVCPWDVPDPCNPTPKRKQSTVADICPSDVPDPSKQTTQRKQSIVADVCPWDVPDPCNPTPQRKQSDVADVCPWDAPDACKEVPLREQSHIADVCPWDAPDLSKQTPQRQQSIAADTCHLGLEDHGRIKKQEGLHSAKFSSNSLGQKKLSTSQDSNLEEVCPWETQDDSLSKEINSSAEYGQNPTASTANKKYVEGKMFSKGSDTSDIECPKVAPKMTQGSVADVCSLDVQESKETNKVQTTLNTEICPWEQQVFPTNCNQKDLIDSKQAMTTKKSDEQILPTQSSVNAEICPWDIPESGQSCKTEVCPWETEVHSTERSSLDSVNKADKSRHQVSSLHENICPWEFNDTENSEKQRDVTSKKSGITEGTSQSEEHPAIVETCPWEKQGTKPCLVKQPAIRLSSDEGEPFEPKSIEGSGFDEVPERKESEKNTTKHENARADICPWETEEVKKQEHNHADICPWETQSPEKIAAEQRTYEAVSPKETKKDRSNPVVGLITEQNQGEISKQDKNEQIMTRKVGSDSMTAEISKTEGCSKQPIPNVSEKMDGVKSSLSRCDALCPWDMQEVKLPSLDKKDSNPNVPLWECDDAADDDAESAAEKFIFPADL